MAVHLTVAGDVFDGGFFAVRFNEISWMRYGTEQFLRIFQSTFVSTYIMLLLYSGFSLY